jgi:hypothetical protein
MPIICFPIYPSSVTLTLVSPIWPPSVALISVSLRVCATHSSRSVVGALTLALGSWTAAEMAQHNVAARVAAALPDMLQEPNQVCGGIRVDGLRVWVWARVSAGRI